MDISFLNAFPIEWVLIGIPIIAIGGVLVAQVQTLLEKIFLKK